MPTGVMLTSSYYIQEVQMQLFTSTMLLLSKKKVLFLDGIPSIRLMRNSKAILVLLVISCPLMHNKH